MLEGAHQLTCLQDYTQLSSWRDGLDADAVVGLVPTMGALHQGHERLLNTAVDECDLVIASVFVNRLQFDNQDDYLQYPRQFDADLELLQQWGASAVYAPSEEDIFPEPNPSLEDPGPGGELFEGYYRRGHFAGMLTVVRRLFERVRPHRAFFGEKDAQQLYLVKQLSAQLNNGPEIVPIATAREQSGLAMSSRNQRLDGDQLKSAEAIFGALSQAASLFAGGLRDSAMIELAMEECIAVAGLRLDYAAVVDATTFLPATGTRPDSPWRAIIAAWVGDVRLIDNIELEASR